MLRQDTTPGPIACSVLARKKLSRSRTDLVINEISHSPCSDSGLWPRCHPHLVDASEPRL